MQSIYGVADAGRANGVMARYEGLARASGPVAAALIYDQIAAVGVFGGLSVAWLIMVPIGWSVVVARENRAASAMT